MCARLQTFQVFTQLVIQTHRPSSLLSCTTMYRPEKRAFATNSSLPIQNSNNYAHQTVSSSAYPSRLNFYKIYPLDEVTIHEFEGFALDRLQILRAIEMAQLRKLDAATIQQACQKYIPLASDNAANTGIDVLAQRRKDVLSHFILRLAFAKSEELRLRFIRNEVTLFRHRWEHCTLQERADFIQRLDLGLERVSMDEKRQYEQELRAVDVRFQNKSDESFWGMEYFKIAWYKVPELVAKNQVYITKGFAYVPSDYQAVYVFDEFKQRLTKEMEYTARAIGRLDDERVNPILNNLARQGFDSGRQEYQTGAGRLAGKVMADDVAGLVTHFPLCMKFLSTALKNDGHLKHGGRMQLGLFLKGIGLSLEEALVFWRRSFRTKTDEQFAKEYSYNIRHNYGQEGKRADYTPYGCHKIITSNRPGAGDYHGCPFRDAAPENLKNQLLSMGIPDQGVNEVLNLSKDRHYQIACTKVFELTHKMDGPLLESMIHPNQYFEMSYGLANPEDSEQSNAKASKWSKMTGGAPGGLATVEV